MTNDAVPVTAEDREAAKQLLDLLRIREHETGSFRSWDDTVQAFARHRGSTAVVDETDPYRILKNALFAVEKQKVGPFSYGGVLTDNGKRAWLTYSLLDEGERPLSQTPATPMGQEGLREALDAAHYYIDASPGELADQGITRDDALRIAREKRAALSATPAQEGEE